MTDNPKSEVTVDDIVAQLTRSVKKAKERKLENTK